MAALGVLGFVVFLAVAIGQMYLGFLGIDHHFGVIWAWVAIAAAFGLRILLPLTIGSYFGAVDVMGWPWYVGVIVAAPGLLFAVPSMITSVLRDTFKKS